MPGAVSGEHEREQLRLSHERTALEVIEDALCTEVDAFRTDLTDHLDMQLPDGTLLAITVRAVLP